MARGPQWKDQVTETVQVRRLFITSLIPYPAVSTKQGLVVMTKRVAFMQLADGKCTTGRSPVKECK
jgi:hypothetical protein